MTESADPEFKKQVDELYEQAKHAEIFSLCEERYEKGDKTVEMLAIFARACFDTVERKADSYVLGSLAFVAAAVT